MSSVCFPSVCSFISLSLSAVNLINNLLQVVVRRRFSVGKAMGHPWFQVCWLSSTINQIRYITGMFNLLKHQMFTFAKPFQCVDWMDRWTLYHLCISCPFVLLQNFQMWCDLREFEQRMGYRYLTHEADDEHWRSYALEKGLSFPEHLAEAANEVQKTAV